MKEGELGGLPQEQGLEAEWAPMGEYLACCDCGLVHRMEFRVKGPDGELVSLSEPRVYVLEVRSFRDREMTEEARKEGSLICKLKGGKDE